MLMKLTPCYFEAGCTNQHRRRGFNVIHCHTRLLLYFEPRLRWEQGKLYDWIYWFSSASLPLFNSKYCYGSQWPAKQNFWSFIRTILCIKLFSLHVLSIVGRTLILGQRGCRTWPRVFLRHIWGSVGQTPIVPSLKKIVTSRLPSQRTGGVTHYGECDDSYWASVVN